MPSDLKKKKAQAKKDARKKKKPTDVENPTQTVETLEGDTVINGTHHDKDAEYYGSDDDDEVIVNKLTKDIESLDLMSNNVAKNRSVTSVLVSHPDACDVKVSSLSISFHGQELLIDANLDLTVGRRYGLLGLNGCGKSTLLAVLANGEVNLPSHLDVYILQREMDPSNKTALQCVMDVDLERCRLEREAEVLALNTHDPNVNDRLTAVYERLDELDASQAEVVAARILQGLGFSHEMQEKQVKHFSGGWRMRIALARALYVRPSLLLLDEPTNHLDLDACVWLERELKNYGRCLVVISHSQDFLNGVVNTIIHFNNQQLKYYTGNYDQYMQTRYEFEENQMKRYKWERDQIAHMKDYIARFGHGSRKLARQAQSKEKVLAKMVNGGLTERVASDKTLTFTFPDCGSLPPPVIQVQNVSFRYGPDKPWIYQDLDFGFDLDRRVAMVGPNGAGKSTLLKLIGRELEPTDGLIRRHSHVRIGRYHQHLSEMLDINLSALKWMMDSFPAIKEIDDMRKKLGRFGLTGQQQITPIKTLSDGQRCRIIFAWLAESAPHILLLDEPTNHLDIETIDSLAEAINDFEGGLMLVSHDFRLISQVAEEIWVCENQTITTWTGDIYSYKEHLIKRIEKGDKKST